MPNDPNEGPPCDCLLCQAAGVTHLPTRWVPGPNGPVRLHGDQLRTWYEQRERFRQFYRSFIAPLPSQRGGGFRPLRQREPGDDDT